MAENPQCSSILVVEDDPSIREGIVGLLEVEGYRVYAAENGKKALDLLQRIETPCLILLDLMMPVMDGWQFTALKNKDIRIAPIPVIVVSAIADSASIEGSKGHIKKPINVDLLLRLVKAYCGHSAT